ncbi:MAG: hypothetical protein QF858_03565 [Candidatus Pacebacteria bacterium]|nr:hypothetical protein [Candidatus Paceibacterota bacterium]
MNGLSMLVPLSISFVPSLVPRPVAHFASIHLTEGIEAIFDSEHQITRVVLPGQTL